MRRYLLVALLPTGLAAIAAVTAIAARRVPVSQAARDAADQAVADQAVAEPAEPAAALPDWVPGLMRLGAIGGAGGVVAYGVMALLGPPVVNHGPGHR